MFTVPIVLLVFRRPDLTRRLVEAVAALKPETLIVAADGPRPDHPEDAALCEQTRAVVDEIKWPGRVLKRYSDVNLGCGLGPSSGITWAFEHVERAIILEDDCLPHPTFFRYCEELLERYRDDKRVMHIAGSTLQRKPMETPYSYRFSHFNVSWGWATWRRAWQHFDIALQNWPELRGTPWLAEILGDETVARCWAADFERAYRQKGDVAFWDYQWAFACWANSGLAVLPRTNLVSNVGCRHDATHTHDEKDSLAKLPADPMHFPLKHPPMVLRHHALDQQFLREVMLPRVTPVARPLGKRMRRLIARVTPMMFKRRPDRLLEAV